MQLGSGLRRNDNVGRDDTEGVGVHSPRMSDDDYVYDEATGEWGPAPVAAAADGPV